MSIKVNLILDHYASRGRVVVKMDRASGFKTITISKRPGNKNVVGTEPHGRLQNFSLADIRSTLEANSIYIEGYN